MIKSSIGIFSSILPAPNPTGDLHLGHTLNLCLQDMYCRWRSILGDDIYWLGAVDHGATSTLDVVTRELKRDNKSHSNESIKNYIPVFIKEHSEKIFSQFQELNLLMDFEEKISFADENFIDFSRNFIKYLHDNGYIYEEKSLVSWSYDLQTSTDISDYNLVDGISNKYLCGATDSVSGKMVTFFVDDICHLICGQAIISSDFGGIINDINFKKYLGLKNMHFLRPNEFQGGFFHSVIFCPSHIKSHFDYAAKVGYPIGTNVGEDGLIIRGKLAGLHVFRDLEEIISTLQQCGLIISVEKTAQMMRVYRLTGEPLTYCYTNQRLFAAHKLLELAQEKIKSGEVLIRPCAAEKYLLYWFELMKGIGAQSIDSEWSIERNIIWGTPFAVPSEPKVKSSRPSVLDMRFSGSLWAFYTHLYYADDISYDSLSSNAICVTGIDLLFFWILPIMLLGCTGYLPTPFKTVIVHPLVCDEFGEKMSKSKGNVISPKSLLVKYGIAVLRLYLISALPADEDQLFFKENEIALAAQWLDMMSRLRVIETDQSHSSVVELSALVQSVEDAINGAHVDKLGNGLRALFSKLYELGASYCIERGLAVRIGNITYAVTGDAALVSMLR
jgi:valyl-tRNA synthetase